MTQAAVAAEAPAPATGTAPGKIVDTARPEPHTPHIAPPSAPKPPMTTTAPSAAPATAPKPRKKAKKKAAAAPKPKAAPKKLDEAKLQRTPITALRSMVRAKKLASGTDIIRLTKDKAIALLLGKGSQTTDSTEVLKGVSPGPSNNMALGQAMGQQNALVMHGSLTLNGPAFEIQRAIDVMRQAGIRLSFQMHGDL